MKKIESKNGTKRYVFEKGDGVRRRFLPFMEEWRVRLPDPKEYAPRARLRHQTRAPSIQPRTIS